MGIYPIFFILFAIRTGPDRAGQKIFVTQWFWHGLKRNGEHLVDPLDRPDRQVLLDVVGDLFQVVPELIKQIEGK